MIGALDRDQVLVSTDWLQERLDDPAIRILDCRFYFDRDAREEYDKGHIPGAYYLDINARLSDPDGDFDMALPPPEQVEEVMRSLGINNDTLIVGYDDEGGHFASRVWLVLARYGAEAQMRVLDGGWTKWIAEDRPVTTDQPAEVQGDFSLDGRKENPHLLASLDDVREAIDTGSATLIDVRRYSEFTGEEVRAKHGGRIPGAQHAMWHGNLNWDADRTFRSAEETIGRPELGNVALDDPVITYCQGGVRASNAAMALRLAGFRNVRVYDGSWAEWGNRDDVPIASGPDDD